MKILLFTENLGSGGAERQLTGLAVLLKEHGHDVQVLYYVDKHFYTPYLSTHSVKYVYDPSLLNNKVRPFRLAAHIRRFNPDVTISYTQGCNMTACLARLMCKTKLIVSERNTNQGVTIKDRILFNLYRISDAVVPNSYAQDEFIRTNFSFLNKKLTTITNFVDTDLFCPTIHNHFTDDGTPIRILTVARIMSQKNCARYLDAVKIVKEKSERRVCFDWYGNVYDDSLDRQLRQQVQDNEIEDVFSFHYASSQIQEEYKTSDIFCLPSLYEGYPNTVCEAMSCGLPIVCSAVCDNPRIVQNGENGILFDPLSVEDMANKLLLAINMVVKKKEQISRKNRERALALFSKDVFINKYIKIINEVL